MYLGYNTSNINNLEKKMIELPALKTRIFNTIDCDEPEVFERTDRFKKNDKIYIRSQINKKVINSNFYKGKKQLVHFVDPIFGVKIQDIGASFIKFSIFGSASELCSDEVYKLSMGDILNFELPMEKLKFELSLTNNFQSILTQLQLEH